VVTCQQHERARTLVRRMRRMSAALSRTRIHQTKDLLGSAAHRGASSACIALFENVGRDRRHALGQTTLPVTAIEGVATEQVRLVSTGHSERTRRRATRTRRRRAERVRGWCISASGTDSFVGSSANVVREAARRRAGKKTHTRCGGRTWRRRSLRSWVWR